MSGKNVSFPVFLILLISLFLFSFLSLDSLGSGR
jgi:hypothetical protein